MNRISIRSRGFGEANVIERIEVGGIKYNARISRPENCDVVIVSSDNVRRLKNLESNILNPRKKRFFGGRRSDPNDYVVFFMDTAFHGASWGGNVLYNNCLNGGEREKVNIRATFSFRIVRGDRLLSLLSETQSKYPRRYLVDKLRAMMDNTVKTCVCRALSVSDFISVQHDTLSLSEQIQERLNRDVLSNVGMAIFNLNLHLEEDEEFVDMRIARQRATAVGPEKDNAPQDQDEEENGKKTGDDE